MPGRVSTYQQILATRKAEKTAPVVRYGTRHENMQRRVDLEPECAQRRGERQIVGRRSVPYRRQVDLVQCRSVQPGRAAPTQSPVSRACGGGDGEIEGGHDETGPTAIGR